MTLDAAAQVAATFDAVAADYDQSGDAFFAPIAERLVARLAVEQWRRFSLGTGQRRLWAHVPAHEHPALLAAAADLFGSSRASDGTIEVGQVVRYTSARR